MRLTIRLLSLLVLTLAGLVVIDACLEYLAERELLAKGLHRHARVLGEVTADLLEDVWRREGPDRALARVRDVDRRDPDVRIRWVWLDARQGEPGAPDRPDPALGVRIAGPSRNWIYVPVATGGSRAGALELSQDLEMLDRRSARTFQRSAIQLAVLFLAAVLTVYVIGVRLIARPLERLREKIDRIGRGDLSVPLVLPGRTELTQLAVGLNTMCDRLAASQAEVAEATAARLRAVDHARHADRLRTVGRLASGVAHELGTPLNVVGGRAALVAAGSLQEQEVKESAEIILSQADRMTEIIRQLLTFARRSPSEAELVDVAQVARQSIALLEYEARKRRLTVALVDETSVPAVVRGSRASVQQVFTNLILNGIQASASTEPVVVEIRTDLVEAEVPTPGNWVRIDVRDRGVGIPDDLLPHVFEPFFTTKGVGEGTGLGLSIVHGIVQDHGGSIAVMRDEAVGTCFRVYLPGADR